MKMMKFAKMPSNELETKAKAISYEPLKKDDGTSATPKMMMNRMRRTKARNEEIGGKKFEQRRMAPSSALSLKRSTSRQCFRTTRQGESLQALSGIEGLEALGGSTGSIQNSIQLAASKQQKKEDAERNQTLQLIQHGLDILELDNVSGDSSGPMASISTFQSVTSNLSDFSSSALSEADLWETCSFAAAAVEKKTQKKKSTQTMIHSMDFGSDDDASVCTEAAQKVPTTAIESSRDKTGITNKDDDTRGGKSSKKSKASKTSSGSKAKGGSKKTKQKKAKLHTRFRLAKNEYLPAGKPLTEDEIARAWWTIEDYERVSAKAHAYAREFEDRHEGPMQELIRLVAQCYASPSSLSPDSRSGLKITDRQYEAEKERMRSCCLLATQAFSIPSRARGLEYDIITPLKKSRQRHSDTVLQAVEDAAAMASDLSRTIDVDDMIASRSIALSRPHRILARALAERDAKLAQMEE